MITPSSFGSCSRVSGGGKNRAGPANPTGDALLLHMGSVKKRLPSISMSRVEWPTHIIPSPFSEIGDGLKELTEKSNSPEGSRVSLSENQRFMVSQVVPSFITTVGTGFLNLPFL